MGKATVWHTPCFNVDCEFKMLLKCELGAEKYNYILKYALQEPIIT
jgi:hypothetical protein